MSRQRIIVILSIILIFTTAAFAQRPVRINFARGAVSASVSGRLSGYRDRDVFLLKVRRGQTISTEQIGLRSNRYITVYITDPRGRAVGDSDASCNSRREIAPTIAGDYRVEVVECKKADPWRGRFRFRVSVR